MIILLSKG